MARLNRVGIPNRYMPANDHPLRTGGGGGTYDDMSDVSREELDAKLDASQSRMEAVESRIDSAISRMETKLSHLPTSGGMWLAAASATVAVVGLMAGFLAFGGDRFDGGFNVGTSSIDRKLGIEQIARENTEQTRQIQTLSNDLNQVLLTLKAIQLQRPSEPPTLEQPKQ